MIPTYVFRLHAEREVLWSGRHFGSSEEGRDAPGAANAVRTFCVDENRGWWVQTKGHTHPAQQESHSNTSNTEVLSSKSTDSGSTLKIPVFAFVCFSIDRVGSRVPPRSPRSSSV